MEKWALKIGLATEGAESDKALHWLTSAKGEDPALIGLTRLEGGGPPTIGVALHLSLGQGCPKSFANEKSQNPGIIGLKSCGSAEVCYTGPKVATPSVVHDCSGPVKEVRGEGSRPAGQEHQAAHPRQGLAGRLEGGRVTLSSWISTSEVPTVTSRADTAAAVKKSEKCRINVKIDIKVKYKRSDEIFETKESQQPANSGSGARSCDWGQRGRGTGERKVVLGGDPATQKPPPWAASWRGQLLCGDHLWSETGLSEIGGGDLRRDRSEEGSNQNGRPKSVQGQLKHEINSPPTRPGVNNHDGGTSPPLTGQQDDQAKRPAVLAASVFVKPRREEVSRGSSRRRRPTSTRATTMISLASWWEFHIFKTERILSMPERWAEMLPALGKNAR